MKVTRLKSGYRITLSDSDFDLLEAMTGMVERDDPDAWFDTLSPQSKAAFTRRSKVSPGFLLQIDEDRRK